ncbi:MAG: Uma2 family endonuclease [Cyanomargarita calcarea GSE-NOS-MK-12-04C]|jgi:Uma2 family endonuclease|uniref:Uma2 family endonuclease n=1 Tax=Cyanomargarita calcarea GSE-NOS-MK-12-04C TaxID=2839659 RepID=A0A951QYB4_9CYAN|nr:Uma2 family endonuclease [Cyanomargarita calcarea GSE-NOS-MK-12-04C]
MTQTQAQTQAKIYTFDEFIEWLPENLSARYELHNRNLIEMSQPTGEHEEVKGFLARKVSVEFDRLNLPYFIPNQAIVKPPEKESGYFPDVLLLNRPNLSNEKRWKKEATVSDGASIPLVIEVVSTNWRDDYHFKFADYEEMGIPEYWIADYAALGGKKFIGDPKQPTFLVCQLVGDEYQVTKFTGNELIISPTFPNLKLTAQQVFDSVL